MGTRVLLIKGNELADLQANTGHRRSFIGSQPTIALSLFPVKSQLKDFIANEMNIRWKETEKTKKYRQPNFI